MPHTPGPWHVNGIDSKRGRITGDETSTGWDKLQVHAANSTVATVYRPRDARLIAAAPRMLELIQRLANLPGVGHSCAWLEGGPVGMIYGQGFIADARAILREIEEG